MLINSKIYYKFNLRYIYSKLKCYLNDMINFHERVFHMKYIIHILGQGLLILLMVNLTIALIPNFIKKTFKSTFRLTSKIVKFLYKQAIYPVIKQVFKSESTNKKSNTQKGKVIKLKERVQ